MKLTCENIYRNEIKCKHERECRNENEYRNENENMNWNKCRASGMNMNTVLMEMKA